MWALCLLVVHPASAFEQLSSSKDIQPLLDLKAMFDEAGASGGRVQLNAIPQTIKQALQTGSRQAVFDLLTRLKTTSYMVDTAQQIWCFPDFNKAGQDELRSDSGEQMLLEQVQNLGDLNRVFPDPLEFCIGIYIGAKRA